MRDENEFKQIEKALTARLYRSQCPSVTMLNHYCARLLSDSQMAAVASHVQACPLCAEEVATTHRVLSDFDPFLESEP